MAVKDWKTTSAGILSGYLAIVGPLTAWLATLPNQGKATTIAGIATLLGAIARAWLGLIQHDAPPSDSVTVTTSSVQNVTKVGVILLLVAVTFTLTGCPSKTSTTQRQQVALAAQNASIVVSGFQQGEIIAYQQGMIPSADHMFVQRELLTVGTVGKTLDSCILSSTSNAGIVACANTASAAIEQINSDGGLYLKSEKAKTTFQLAMVGVKTAIGVIATIFGGQ